MLTFLGFPSKEQEILAVYETALPNNGEIENFETRLTVFTNTVLLSFVDH